MKFVFKSKVFKFYFFNMKFSSVYPLTRDLILTPQNTFRNMLSEDQQKKSHFSSLLFMAVLIGISSILGSILSGDIHDGFSIGYILFEGIISFIVIYLEVNLAALIILRLASAFDNSAERDKIFKLVIFSQAPFFLSLILIKIFPDLLFLGIVGFYSFYLFYTGVGILSEMKQEEKTIFLLLSILVMIVLYYLLTLFFNSIYNVVVQQITTFVSYLQT